MIVEAYHTIQARKFPEQNAFPRGKNFPAFGISTEKLQFDTLFPPPQGVVSR
jgi:hypothetical protein